MKFRLNSPNLAFLLVLPVFSYINLRAWFLAFTYDESWTFLGYATEDFWKVVTNEFPAANNHVLHSLIMGWVYEFSVNRNIYSGCQCSCPLLSLLISAMKSLKIYRKKCGGCHLSWSFISPICSITLSLHVATL